MKPRGLTTFVLWAIVILLPAWAAMVPIPLEAGEWHVSSKLICSDCHTMHFSEAGAAPTRSEAGGPWPRLLLYSTVNKLCLSCHDGTDTTAPDILDPVTMYSGSGDEHSAGGFFENSGGTSSSRSHDLDVTASTVPLSSMTNVTLSCASCHDPHGTTNYRNLKAQPGAGTGTTVVKDTDVFENVAPADPPTESGSINAYKESNIGYRSNMVSWCAECHDSLASNTTASAPAHFQRHPSNVPIDGAGYHTEPTHWTGGTGLGFGTTTGDGTEGVPRVRFQVPTATSYVTATTVASSNEVFCPTCHLAHGGSYGKNLVWPYFGDEAANPNPVADMYSACEQCHNQ